MRRKRIGIDLDSTLNTLEKQWIEAINLRDNLNLTVEDMKQWDCTTWGGPDAIEPLLKPGFFKTLGIKKDSQEIVKNLSSYYDLYIVTAYFAETCSDKRDWVREHFPFIPEGNIIFINDKFLLEGIDYLIDDGPHNIEAFPNKTILVDAPYNQHLELYDRVYGWNDVWSYFEKELNLEKAR